MMKYSLLVNGFENNICVHDDEIMNIHRVILEYLSCLHRKYRRRIICLYAAPPGTGKSTNTALWEYLSTHDENLEELQTLSIDGFHYFNKYLLSHTILREGREISLKSIKGAPETYNVEMLHQYLQRYYKGEDVNWPYYDRNIHDPVLDKIQMQSPIIVVEGNWVLLQEPIWDSLKDYADLTIYHDAEDYVLKDRLIGRKIRGGYSYQEAHDHYIRSDKENIKRVRNNHWRADITLLRDTDKQCLKMIDNIQIKKEE